MPDCSKKPGLGLATVVVFFFRIPNIAFGNGKAFFLFIVGSRNNSGRRIFLRKFDGNILFQKTKRYSTAAQQVNRLTNPEPLRQKAIPYKYASFEYCQTQVNWGGGTIVVTTHFGDAGAPPPISKKETLPILATLTPFWRRRPPPVPPPSNTGGAA